MIAERHRLALPSGYQLGKYRFREVLGSGGFGITYLAEDSSLSRRVAIKELLPNDIATRVDGSTVVAKTKSEETNLAWARERFVEEGRALAACDHPNVVNVYELIEANGTAYMVTKFEEGRSLADWLRDLGRAPDEAELRGILLPLLSGLEKVHRAGFLHRDIKPENIYLTDDGRPLLLDFGSARQAVSDRSTAMTSIVTAGYAPFEQYHEDGKQGAWSDIYALGAVLYRAITGKKPPEATRRLKDDPCVKLAKAHAGAYTPRFLDAIDSALAVDASKRPQNVASWRRMIGEGPVAAPPAVNQLDLALEKLKGLQLPPLVRNNPLPVLAAAGIALLLVCWLVWKISRPKPKLPPPIAAAAAPLPTQTAASPVPPAQHALAVAHPPVSAPVSAPAPAPAPAPVSAPAPVPAPVSAAVPVLATATATSAFPAPSPSPAAPTASVPSQAESPNPAQSKGPRPGQPWQNSLGVRFAPLPGGGTAHMAVWKTRRSDFEAFVQATGYNADGGMTSSILKGSRAKGITWRNPGFAQTQDHPVVGVDAYDALAFCQWLTEKELKDGVIGDGYTYRLPTDEEWTAAAGNSAYPWGDAWPPADSVGNFAGNEARSALGRLGVIPHYSDGFVATSPVGSFPPNPSGFYDIGGNAAEWCGSWYRRDLNSDEVLRKIPRLQDDGDGKSELTLRGSSCFTHSGELLRLDTRSAEAPTTRSDAIGFRVVLGPKNPEALYELPRLLSPSSGEKDEAADGSSNAPPGDDSDSTDKVDPKIVGIWETKGVKDGAAWIWRWDQQANGHFTYSKTVSDTGTVTAVDGKLRVFSDDSQEWTDSTYELLNSTTLVTDGPLGRAVWKRIATHTGSTRKRSGESQSSSEESRHTYHEPPRGVKDFIRRILPF